MDRLVAQVGKWGRAMNIVLVAIFCAASALVGLLVGAHYGYKFGFEDGKDDYKHVKEINPGSTL